MVAARMHARKSLNWETAYISSMRTGVVLLGVFILFLGLGMIVYSFPVETLTRTVYVYPYRFIGAFVLPVGFVIAVIGYALPEYEHPPKEFFFISFILIFTFSWTALFSLYRSLGTRPLLAFLASLWVALFFSAVATLVCTAIYGLYNMMKKRRRIRS